MDRFTRTRIPAQHHGLTCSRKRTHFASTVLATIITVTAKYLSFVGSTMVDKAGRPWLSRASMRPWPRPLALAQEASWARTTPPLFLYVYVRTYIHTVGINRGQSGNMETAAVRLYFILEHNYSLVILVKCLA